MELIIKNAKDGKDLGNIDFLSKHNDCQVNLSLIHEAVLNYLANNRSGNASTKTRAEVSGGGKKPWKQKGTGRARAGSNRSPIWRHGGVTFGPKPRDYSYSMPKKKRRLALVHALIGKLENKELVVLDKLDSKINKTKQAAEMVNGLGLDGNILLVLDKKYDNFELSCRNLANVNTTYADKLCVYDIVWHDSVVLTRESADFLNQKFMDGNKK